MTQEDKETQDKQQDKTTNVKNPAEAPQTKPNDKKKVMTKVKGWVGSLFSESIMLDSKRAFVCFNKTTKKIEVHDKMEDENGIYVPLEKFSYGYEPYSFSSKELNELASTEITKESLLDEIKGIVDLHLHARDEVKHLVIGDVLLTYSQEWITTTHFIWAVGETGSGKSTLTQHFRHLGYRCLYGTNLAYANIYNFLGKDEEGAGTIAEDEAQDMGFERNKIRLYKNSYAKGSRQPIMDMHEGRNQIFYWIFCFKAFSAEKSLEDRGMLERLAICYMMEDRPEKNIKKPSLEILDQFRKLRNKMLVWKLQNMEKGLGQIESNLEGRDQELYEDYLKIMSGTKYEEAGKKTVEYFVKQRHGRIWDSIEAKIFRILLKVKTPDNKVFFQDLWNEIPSSPEISVDFENGSYVDRDTGQRITRNFLAKTIMDKFRGKKMVDKEFYEKDGDKKQRRITYYVFEQKDLSELTTKYNVEADSD